MNAIQDRFADLTNFSQTIDLQAVRIGASDLQLIRYGTAEGRVTGALRTDGLLRGLGGVLPGAFTTTQRDAIAAGNAPTGTIIYNSSVGALQVNLGSDVSRNWKSLESQTGVAAPTGRFAGEMAWHAGNISVAGLVEPVPGWLCCNGVAISRSTYADLFTAIGTAYGAGDGSTTFGLPNFTNGKIPITFGGTFSRGAAGGVSSVTLTGAQVPSHTHSIPSESAHAHNGSGLSYDHVHACSQLTVDMHRSMIEASGYGLVTSQWFQNQVMVHAVAQPNTYVIGDTDGQKNATMSGSTGTAGAHSHGGATGANAGGGASHDNMPPYQVAGQILIKY